MVVQVKKHATGYLINDRVFITTDGSHDAKYVNLALQTWPDMQYGNHDISFIEYPGEYDINGMYIRVYSGKWWELNYHIQEDAGKSYAFVQTEDSLANDEFIADEWIYVNPHIAKALDKMEMEGTKIDLTQTED